jgi:hypothetical protein
MGLQIHVVGIRSALVPHWQAEIGVSVSLYYDMSNMAQMFAGLILQFSAFHFCFSKIGEMKGKKKEKNGFPAGRMATTSSLVVMCCKKVDR